MVRFFSLPVLVLLFLSMSLRAHAAPAPANGSDWPHWLGPNRDGTSPEKGLLRQWPAGGPQVLWRAKIQQGWSVPSVAGQEVYVSFTDMTQKRDDNKMTEGLVCLDAASGAERWKYTYLTVPYYSRNLGWPVGGVRATPSVTQRFVYHLGTLGHLLCLERATGKVAWEADLDTAWFPGPYQEWKGACFSPVVEDGKLILPLLRKDSYIRPNKADTNCAALDAATGKVLWNTGASDKPEPGQVLPAFATPLLTTIGGEKCVVRHEMNRFSIFKLADGKLLLDHEHGEEFPNDNRAMDMGSPIPLNGGFVIPPGPGSLTLLTCDYAAKSAKHAWKATDGANPIYGFSILHTFMPCAGYLYGFTGSVDANNLPVSKMNLHCVDAKTGKAVWSEQGFTLGISLICADGLLFVRSAQSLRLVEASPNGFAQKGSVDKLHDLPNAGGKDGGWVMPVLAHGRLYVRCPGELICYKVK